MSILDQSLAQGRSQLEPFGLAGVVPLQGIAAALSLITCFESGPVQDHRPKKSKCFAALSQRPISVFLPPIYAWLYAESSLQCLTILPGKCPVLVQTCVSVSLP